MPTLAEVRSSLARYAGVSNSFTDRLNEVRARLLQSNSGRGTKEQITLTVYADASGTPIVTLPRGYKTILAGALRSPNVLCTGAPMGVRGEFAEFDPNGLGYGGLTQAFDEVPGRFSCYQEWATPIRIRFKFEVSESAGSIYVSGTLAGEDVWALNSATWEKREAVAFSGTTAVTTTKYYDAYKFAIKKPVTNGRVTAYAVDDAGIETPIGVYEPSETLPRWKRFKVPKCDDVSALSSSVPVTVTQFYTKSEIQAMFADSGTITVSTSGTTDLDYAAYFLRTVKIVAAAGSGGYTRNFTLDTSKPQAGAQFTVRLEVAASANPTLNFYNDTTGGTLLLTVLGDPDNTQYQTIHFEFDGSNWHVLA